MWVPFFYGAILTVILTVYLLVTHNEARQGRRFFAAKMRAWLDRFLNNVVTAIERTLRYVVRYLITLSWYYSLHACLKICLRFLAGLYYAIEGVLLKNRERVRALRKEKRNTNGHFAAIAAHKSQTKLTPKQEQKRKAEALEGK
jgi:hypothetical protein